MRKEQTENVPVLYESIAAWSKRTGMTVGAIYVRLKKGDLHGIKVGRRTLIHVTRGLEWLEARRWEPTGPVSKRQSR